MTLNQAIGILKDAKIDSAEHDARSIFRHFGGFSDAELVLRGISSDNAELIDAVHRRANREPLQYIIGRVDFYRECYIISPACLIPRSDTEILVDYAVKNLPDGASFMDLCTGSGCIAISTLKNTKNTTAIAVDIDPKTLEITRENARLCGVEDRISIRALDLLSNDVEDKVFAVLSNPPYVTPEAYAELEGEIFHEPKKAFLGGDDGGDFYRHLTPIYKNKIDKHGFIAYEIGYDQADLLRKIATENQMICEIIKDYSGNDRVAVLKNI